MRDNLPESVDCFGRACCEVALLLLNHHLLTSTVSRNELEMLCDDSDVMEPGVDLESLLNDTDADCVRRLAASLYMEDTSGDGTQRLSVTESGIARMVMICYYLGGVRIGDEIHITIPDATLINGNAPDQDPLPYS